CPLIRAPLTILDAKQSSRTPDQLKANPWPRKKIASHFQKTDAIVKDLALSAPLYHRWHYTGPTGDAPHLCEGETRKIRIRNQAALRCPSKLAAPKGATSPP
ncbi:hypothetical protein, partial [Roseomonas indoligenes]